MIGGRRPRFRRDLAVDKNSLRRHWSGVISDSATYYRQRGGPSSKFVESGRRISERCRLAGLLGSELTRKSSLNPAGRWPNPAGHAVRRLTPKAHGDRVGDHIAAMRRCMRRIPTSPVQRRAAMRGGAVGTPAQRTPGLSRARWRRTPPMRPVRSCAGSTSALGRRSSPSSAGSAPKVGGVFRGRIRPLNAETRTSEPAGTCGLSAAPAQP